MKSLSASFCSFLVILILMASGTAFARPVACPVQTGLASWYAPSLEGHRTFSGEPYQPTQLTAAHMTLPMNTRVRVTNRANGRSVDLRINDRGPFVQGRMIDLSRAAADAIGMRGGMLAVRVSVLCPDPPIFVVPPRKPEHI